MTIVTVSKIKSLDELVALRAVWKEQGRKVVWTNGCFDILHAGHARSLADAKALGDVLVVGINSDAGVRALKGPGRPLMSQDDRAELLAALAAVDFVTVFEEPDPVHPLSRLRPDIHCKGAEYADGSRPIPERETVLSYGGEVRFLPLLAGRSTTGIIQQQPVFRLLEKAPGLRILVVGDVMLDSYVSGEAGRISPEAPVPVVAVSRRRHVAGGAANVAANIRTLGASVNLAGIVGTDPSSAILRCELERGGIESASLIEDPARVTTTKTRITAGGQQIVRFDEEETGRLREATETRLRILCAGLMPQVHACVISDYAKGVASESFCRWLIETAAAADKPVVVDPKCRDLSRYRGATVITPNLKETSVAAGEPIHTDAELAHAAGRLCGMIGSSALLVTRGGDGMSLFEPECEPFRIPALPVEVADVTGAGDTVVAVLAIALGAGMNLREASVLANLAAGIAVRHTGTWAVTREELLADKIHHT